MHRKAAEHFKSFGRTEETKNKNFLELGLMNIPPPPKIDTT